MFKGISENPVVPFGKFTGPSTIEGKSSHFKLGEEPMDAAQSATQ